MNYAPFQNLPMVLETPIEVKGPDGKMIEDKKIWADEIKLLESLIDMDPTSDEFVSEAEKLQVRGASERARIQEQVDRKVEKDAKKAETEKKKAAKKEAANGKTNGTRNGKTKKAVKGKSSKSKDESSSELSSCDSCSED